MGPKEVQCFPQRELLEFPLRNLDCGRSPVLVQRHNEEVAFERVEFLVAHYEALRTAVEEKRQ